MTTSTDWPALDTSGKEREKGFRPMTCNARRLAAISGAALSFALVTASVNGGPARLSPSAFVDDVLAITTNNGSQQIEILIGPEPGVVRFIGVEGIPDTPFTGITAIDLRTGSGQDAIEVRVFAAEAPDLFINTGANQSDVKVIYEVATFAASAQSTVSVTGGTSDDKVAFEVLSASDTFVADWTVVHGNGNNETKVVYDASQAASLASITLSTTSGSGEDKLDAEIKSGAADVDLDIYGLLGAGNDSALINISEQSPGFTRLALDINLGSGIDVGEIVTVLQGGQTAQSGRVLGGADSDFLKLLQEGAGVNNILLNAGAGADNIDMEFKGAVTGAPKQRAGNGNDFLKLVATNPALLNPLLDGGAGFDVAIGFGRIINVEQID
jgi:hypothetical protein